MLSAKCSTCLSPHLPTPLYTYKGSVSRKNFLSSVIILRISLRLKATIVTVTSPINAIVNLCGRVSVMEFFCPTKDAVSAAIKIEFSFYQPRKQWKISS